MRPAVAFIISAPVLTTACTMETPYVDEYNARLVAQTQPFVAELNDGSATALSATPVEDSASMSGTFFIVTTDIANMDAMAGKIDMQANFASAVVSGQMHDFVEVQDITATPLTGKDMFGEVNYSGRLLVRNGDSNDIAATGSGSIRATDATVYYVTTAMNGDIYRRDGGELGAAGAVTMTAKAAAASGKGTGLYFVTE